jgi:glycosyltransferase involved in cell wall biosynthesis
MPGSRSSILGISFDGLAVSGIVNEFLNVANIFRRRGFRVLLDLGYDITMQKPLDFGHQLLPGWAELVRSVGSNLPEFYSANVIAEATASVVSGSSVNDFAAYRDLCRQLAELLVATFLRENLRFLVVENGTLPDNPLFTEAIYQAIAEYGRLKHLGKYVLWRDHDLMWSTEPHLYGSFPYRGVRMPELNQHIHYVVVTAWMQRRMQAWAPGPDYHVIPNRFFLPTLRRQNRDSLRSTYAIPADAYLVARCTRIIPQKSIERDLRLFDQIQQRLEESGDGRRVFLFVTGPTEEDPEEYNRLCLLEKNLSIARQVIWGNGLLPLNPLISAAATGSVRFSIFDLLSEAALSSFLTTYDYEGFGNPPGESMAMGVPFISTTYELYHEVYGSKGAVAPLLPINRTSVPSDPIPEYFVTWTMRALTDAPYRSEIIKHNLEVCHLSFSLEALERQLKALFDLS